MAGNGEDDRMYVLLLIITIFMRLALIRRRSRFQQRLQLLRSNKRRREEYFHLRRKLRKKKIAWAFERPQFWFEHMVLSHYENNMWREHFRISRQTFRFVCDLVRPHLGRQDTNMRRAIPVEKRVAVALWRLATGNSYRSTGLVFGVGRCTALNLKDEFCSALLMSAKDFIKFPKGEAETRRAIEAFQEISFFPQVVGAIDGSHIPIITPKNYPNDYYNKKQFHSIVLQGVVDADGRFIHVSTGYAGSIHDARVLRMSSLVNEVEDRKILVSPVTRTETGEEIRPLLVADPACKLTNWCMKPYPETRAITASQRNFNKALSRARVVIEQPFGMLKGRWRCLLVKLDESVDKIPLTITTCCILHNICIEVRDDVDVDPAGDDPDEFTPLPGHMNGEGSRLRNKIKEAFFSN